jgi:hypothetical protein
LLIAEQSDYEGADHEKAILEARNEGRISSQTCSRLLETENEIHEQDLEAVAFELLTTRYGWSSVGSAPLRRWRTELTDDEDRERRRLQKLRVYGGFTAEDDAIYARLTEPQPVERVDWDSHPGLRREAEAVLRERSRRVRGETRRDKRVSATDRRRLSTFDAPSFREQIRPIATASTPAEIERAVQNYRRAAKRRGVLPVDHDRRRRHKAPAD